MFKSSTTVLVGAGYWGSKILEKLLILNSKVIVLDVNNKNLGNLKNKYNNKNLVYINSFKDLNQFRYENVIITLISF